MHRDTALEAEIVTKYAAIEPLLALR